MEKIQELHVRFNGILGYRRMTHFLNRDYNKKRIRRLMRILEIQSLIRRPRGYCTKTSFVNIEENILNRDFTAEKPNEKWCTDVTFLKYGLGKKAYLSAMPLRICMTVRLLLITSASTMTIHWSWRT